MYGALYESIDVSFSAMCSNSLIALSPHLPYTEVYNYRYKLEVIVGSMLTVCMYLRFLSVFKNTAIGSRLFCLV